MLRTLKLLSECPAVRSYEVQDFRRGDYFYYLKIQAELQDGTVLYIREYVSDEEYNYSYHWQDRRSKMIARWDNAPHHRQIATFPHHKHNEGKVMPSYDIDIGQVLNYITKHLNLEP